MCCVLLSSPWLCINKVSFTEGFKKVLLEMGQREGILLASLKRSCLTGSVMTRNSLKVLRGVCLCTCAHMCI